MHRCPTVRALPLVLLGSALALWACEDDAGGPSGQDAGNLVQDAGGGADGAGASDTASVDAGGTDVAAPPDGGTDVAAPPDAADVDAPPDAADAGQDASTDPLAWPVDQDGPFQVGYRVLHTTYTPPGDLPERTIEVHVWYPTAAPTEETPTYLGLFPDPNVTVDAPKAPSPYPAGHPVLVHSHGHMGFAGNSAELMRYVATHGWVAVAPEHKGNTLLDTPDPRPLAIFLQRVLDVRAALDLVLTLAPPDPLAGALDVDRVAMSGHSFGTTTTWAVAGTPFDPVAIQAKCDVGALPDCSPALVAAFAEVLSDSRPRLFVPMAGGASDLLSWPPTSPVPVLQMTGSLDAASAAAVFDSATSVDLTWADIEGGCHQLFGLGNAVLGDAACKALPDAEGFAIVDTLLLAALRYHVLGDPTVAGILDGTTPVSPRVTLKHKAP